MEGDFLPVVKFELLGHPKTSEGIFEGAGWRFGFGVSFGFGFVRIG